MARHAKQDLEPVFDHTLAHDLNNELGIILAECDLLESTLRQENSMAFRRVKAIKTSARRMANRLSGADSTAD